MTATSEHRDDFHGLTIRDQRGGRLVCERDAAGRMQVWIAPPGESDGPGVVVSDDDAQHLAGFFGSKVAEERDVQQMAAEQNWAELQRVRTAVIGYHNETAKQATELLAEIERMRPVVEAANAWRKMRAGTDPAQAVPETGALIEAVDALPDCRADLSGVGA